MIYFYDNDFYKEGVVDFSVEDDILIIGERDIAIRFDKFIAMDDDKKKDVLLECFLSEKSKIISDNISTKLKKDIIKKWVLEVDQCYDLNRLEEAKDKGKMIEIIRMERERDKGKDISQEVEEKTKGIKAESTDDLRAMIISLDKKIDTKTNEILKQLMIMNNNEKKYQNYINGDENEIFGQ